MDYKVKKWMNNFAFLSKQSFPRLSSAPAKSFIDPGVARIAPLHHLYVPLTSKKSFTHEISKQISNDESQPMAGTGLIEPEVMRPEPLSDETKKLSEGVLYSFMHPKIETDKIVFETKARQLKRASTPKETVESKKPKVEKKMSHKFQFL